MAVQSRHQALAFPNLHCWMRWRGIEKLPSFQDDFGIVGTLVSMNVKYPIAVHEIASKSGHRHLSNPEGEAAKPRGETSPLGPPTIWGRVVGRGIIE
jgi:hypothetical protein